MLAAIKEVGGVKKFKDLVEAMVSDSEGRHSVLIVDIDDLLFAAPSSR